MLLKNYSLKNYNTMKVDAKANHFYIVKDLAEIEDLLKKNSFNDFLILGSGSNILFTKNYEGLVIKNEINGINVLYENEEIVQVKVGGGVNWHEFVMSSVKNNWSGIENLALIPGTVGASPVQNIGAYGQEVKDVIHSVEAFNLFSLTHKIFSNKDCNFSYRHSIFKQQLKKEYLITSVTFNLKKNFEPNLSYPVIKNALSKKGITNPTIEEVAETVIEIRQSKLPDYTKLSNCGSFFMNPFLPKDRFDDFINSFPDAPHFNFNDGYKISAGWLIEQCGWKGKRIGNVGCYEKHALVIVNYGNASGKEILDFADMIRKSVYEKFGVMLDYEVYIV